MYYCTFLCSLYFVLEHLFQPEDWTWDTTKDVSSLKSKNHGNANDNTQGLDCTFWDSDKCMLKEGHINYFGKCDVFCSHCAIIDDTFFFNSIHAHLQWINVTDVTVDITVSILFIFNFVWDHKISSQLTYLLFFQFSFTCTNVYTVSCKCFRLDVVVKGYLDSKWCISCLTKCIHLNGKSNSQLWEHIFMYICNGHNNVMASCSVCT